MMGEEGMGIRIMRVICFALLGSVAGVLLTAFVAMICFDVIYPAIIGGFICGFVVGLYNEGFVVMK